ncbi:MAG: DUF4097 domain-containing protein [Ruminococcaceae bacterium]|nr:DUF4097 domain-containing protein [Oscillospiraceae bacterium]
MGKTTKVWLVIAASLVLVGGIMFVCVMSILDWDFMRLSTVNYKTNTYEISEAFDGISMNTDTADITFVLSNDQKCKVECYEKENLKHSVMVKNGLLNIELVDKRSVYDYIELNFGSPKITVYLPKSEYASLFIREYTGDVKIPKDFTFWEAQIFLSTGDIDFGASALGKIKMKTSTGDIGVKNISAGSLELSVSTGDVNVCSVNCKGEVSVGVSTGKTHLTDIECKKVISSGSTGDILLKNIVAQEKLSIERSTGDVKFESCDAAEISIETDTGDVTGSLLTDKVFITETDTGSVDVPKSVTGGMCEISTDTGDIKVSVKG